MKSFEHYKYKAENLRILGIALITPLASALYQLLMTDTSYDVNLILCCKALVMVIIAAFGFMSIYQGLEILEKCDELSRGTSK